MSASADMTTLREGYRTSHGYTISREIYEQFIAAFGDVNPLHIEDRYARSRGFPERVMHGIILHGFVSHFLGVHFPGAGVLLHSIRTEFKTPCHLGDQIRIDAVVSQVSEGLRVATIQLLLVNVTRDRVAAKTRAQVGLL